MCTKCVEALDRHFPDLSGKEQMDVLWEFTAFPAGSAETIERQLAEHAATVCQDQEPS